MRTKSNLCKELPRHITTNPKALYTAALKWWNKRSSAKDDHIDVHEETSFSSELDETSCDEPKRSVKFTIELSAKVWETIKPVTVLYSRKNKVNAKDDGVRCYDVLRPGVWTNVIVDHVTKARRDIPCVWTFENNKCHRDGAIYIRLKASCKMCSAILNGIIKDEPEEDEPVIIIFEITSLDLACHNNVEPANVKIGGEYAKKLSNKREPATVIRRSLLRKRANIFERPYGRVPSANALRCAKSAKRKDVPLSVEGIKLFESIDTVHEYNSFHCSRSVLLYIYQS